MEISFLLSHFTRLTSTDQWHIVKQSLERLVVMEVYDPDSLETSLVALNNLLMANSSISCILVDSINTFYQQVLAIELHLSPASMFIFLSIFCYMRGNLFAIPPRNLKFRINPRSNWKL